MNEDEKKIYDVLLNAITRGFIEDSAKAVHALHEFLESVELKNKIKYDDWLKKQ